MGLHLQQVKGGGQKGIWPEIAPGLHQSLWPVNFIHNPMQSIQMLSINLEDFFLYIPIRIRPLRVPWPVSGVCRYPDQCQVFAGTLTSVRSLQIFAKIGLLRVLVIQNFPGYHKNLSAARHVPTDKVTLLMNLLCQCRDLNTQRWWWGCCERQGFCSNWYLNEWPLTKDLAPSTIYFRPPLCPALEVNIVRVQVLGLQ